MRGAVVDHDAPDADAPRELAAHRRGHVRPEADLRHAEIEQRERDDQRRGVVADRDRDRHASRAAFPHEPCGAALDLRDERAVRHVVGRARDCRRGTRIARVPPQRFAEERPHGRLQSRRRFAERTIAPHFAISAFW